MFCYKLIKHKYFEYMTLAIIIWNSIVLALDDPTQEATELTKTFDLIFLVLYTIEMVLKIVGMGFMLNKGSYLRETWNVLDFIIVVSAYIPYFLESDGTSVDLTALRSLRVLRPLRTISSIGNLRLIITSLLNALPTLRDLILILLLLFMVFAIAGLQLFMGLLKRRCFLPETGRPWLDEEGESMLCGSQTCPGGFVCGKMIQNPKFGVVHFDDIANSFLMVFQIVTLEGWNEIMVFLQSTFTSIVSLYFVALIFCGSFFLLNLFLAVIKVEFTKTGEKKVKRALNHDEKLEKLLQDHKEKMVKLMREYRKKRLTYYKLQILQTGQLRRVDGRLLEEQREQRRRTIAEGLIGGKTAFSSFIAHIQHNIKKQEIRRQTTKEMGSDKETDPTARLPSSELKKTKAIEPPEIEQEQPARVNTSVHNTSLSSTSANLIKRRGAGDGSDTRRIAMQPTDVQSSARIGSEPDRGTQRSSNNKSGHVLPLLLRQISNGSASVNTGKESARIQLDNDLTTHRVATTEKTVLPNFINVTEEHR